MNAPCFSTQDYFGTVPGTSALSRYSPDERNGDVTRKTDVSLPTGRDDCCESVEPRVVRLLRECRHTLQGIFQGIHRHLDQATRRTIQIDDQHDDGSDHQRYDQ